MKVGIFGDSFASPNKLNSTLTWVDILSTKYDLTNHAVSASNLYYSVDLIKKNHLEYDKIILVVTQPGRLKISNWIPVDKLANKFIIGLNDPNYVNVDLTTIESSYIEAGNQYFTYLQDSIYDKYIHDLMVNDIRRFRSDIILIPGFIDSIENIKYSCMKNIFLKENAGWKISQTTISQKLIDLRNCHMTAENNEIFAINAEKWLFGEPVHINLDDFVTTTDKDFYLKQK